MSAHKLPFFVTIPHSGEKVPDFCEWLHGLPEEILMCDVDRFVDKLYEPALDALKIPFVKTEWHRYAADLNRVPDDVDRDSVEGNKNPSGMHNRGFHWVVTTQNNQLMRAPTTRAIHEKLIDLIYVPFHYEVQSQFKKFHELGNGQVFHIDAHSMPSLGTKMHRDPGEKRADIVISDCVQKSSKPEFVELIKEAYKKAGFGIAYNWPYLGGRVSEQYGEPAKGHHTVQVELNRSLYMNEVSKKYNEAEAKIVQLKVQEALDYIQKNLTALI